MNDPRGEDEASDGELWRRAAAGDGEAFAVVYDRHKGAVRTFCARRTGSLDVADDLVSVVFLEAWRRRREVELVDDVALPWLYGVARRTLQRRWRTTLTHRRALQRLPPALTSPDHADEVAARVDDQRHLDDLQRSVAGMSESDREVLTLCVWQGLDYASAAIALGVPLGTVRSRLARARARLQRDAPERGVADERRPSGEPTAPTRPPPVQLRRPPIAASRTPEEHA